MSKKNIILASASPRRKLLLKMLGLDFKVIQPEIDEQFNPDLNIDDNLKIITKSKALFVLKNNPDSDMLIISADTVVLNEGSILTKPKDSTDAFNMLKSLSGKQHCVTTGIFVIDSFSRKEIFKSQTTAVTFKHLEDDEILKYISSGEAFDKAGSYGIQGKGSLFVKEINGCYYNVVGLPLVLLSDILIEYNISLL